MRRTEANPTAERLALALELCEAGIEIHKAQLRRRHPQESEDELARRLAEWLQGDLREHGYGHLLPWPARRP